MNQGFPGFLDELHTTARNPGKPQNHPESPIDVAPEWHRVEIKRNRFSPRPVLRVIWLSEHREPGRTKYEIDHRQNVLRIRREFKLLRELQ